MPKSTCCGVVSLRSALIFTTLIDVTVGIAAGFLLYMLVKADVVVTSLAVKALLEFLRAVSAVVCLAIMLTCRETMNQGFKLRSFKVYFICSLMTAFVLPLIDLYALVQVHIEVRQSEFVTSGVWLYAASQFVGRFYLAYLIYGYYKRLANSETLLLEVGPRKLQKMIDELKAEQQHKIFELKQMSERGHSVVPYDNLDF